MSGQYSATTLDVNVTYQGSTVPIEIDNIAWTGDNFTGTIDGVSINGVDNNGNISGSGNYMGQQINANGVVTCWN
jgi:hypothetical protein